MEVSGKLAKIFGKIFGKSAKGLSLSLYNAVMCAFMAENSIGSIRNGRFSILTKIKGEEKRFV